MKIKMLKSFMLLGLILNSILVLSQMSDIPEKLDKVKVGSITGITSPENIRFSSDNKYLIAVGYNAKNETFVRVYDVATKKIISQSLPKFCKYQLLKDNRIAISNREKIDIFNIVNLTKPIRSFAIASIDFAFSPDETDILAYIANDNGGKNLLDYIVETGDLNYGLTFSCEGTESECYLINENCSFQFKENVMHVGISRGQYLGILAVTHIGDKGTTEGYMEVNYETNKLSYVSPDTKPELSALTDIYNNGNVIYTAHKDGSIKRSFGFKGDALPLLDRKDYPDYGTREGFGKMHFSMLDLEMAYSVMNHIIIFSHLSVNKAPYFIYKKTINTDDRYFSSFAISQESQAKIAVCLENSIAIYKLL